MSLPGGSSSGGGLPGSGGDDLGVRISGRISQTIIKDDLVIVGDTAGHHVRVVAGDNGGVLIQDGESVKGQWQADGDIVIGDPGGEHVEITDTAVNIKDGATTCTGVGAGVVTVGRTDQDHIHISGNGIEIKDDDVVRGRWQSDGDIFIGSDVGDPATTYISVFANAQTYNSESIEAGDMLIGDNSAEKANIFWDKSQGRLKFRGGVTTTLEVDTDGSLLAGRVTLNQTGISITEASVRENASAYTFVDGNGEVLKGLYGWVGLAHHSMVLEASAVAGTNTNIWISAYAPIEEDATVTISAEEEDYDQSYIRVKSGSAGTGTIILNPVEYVLVSQGDLRLSYGGIVIGSSSIDPPNRTLVLAQPSANQVDVYIKNDNLIFKFYDGGTTRYKYLDLTGSGATWQHATTEP